MMPTPESPEISRQDAFGILLDASAMLQETSSESTVLSGILDAAGKLIAADAYAVWRSSEGGLAWRAVATRGLSTSYRTEIAVPARTSLQSIDTIEDTLDLSVENISREVYLAEGVRSLLIVPFKLQSGADATITFYWHQPRRFSQLDRDYATGLTNLSTAALNMSDLQASNLREKQRLSFLAEASAVLASSLDYETTLDRVARLAVPTVADWCTVHIVENGVVNRLVVAHADPSMLEYAAKFSRKYPEQIRQDMGLGAVLRTGVTEVYTHISDEMLVAGAQNPEHLAEIRKLGLTSSILVALHSRGKILGAIRLLASGGTRHFTQDDVQLAEDLARRAAAAIDNAQLHRAILEQQSQLRLSHASARMGSWSMDLAKGQVVWSDEFKALHGLPLETVASLENGAALIHPEDRERSTRELTAVLASDSDLLTMENRALAPDGRVLWVQSRGRIERDTQGRAVHIHGISIDVTESRQAENALRRTEKLAAAGRLAATVAHEVNNPLESLMNLLYLAQCGDGIPEDTAKYLKTAEGEVNRMAHIVRQTLGFYRESVHPRAADLGPVVEEVLELYRSRATTRSVDLSHTAEPGLTAVVNAGEIKQVISNLVSNAIDATPPGGSVHTQVKREDGFIHIAVTDTGSGITDANLQHLFEPFFTTKADVGTGLGLWVSKGIIEKHGGGFTVASRTEAPSGTTMCCTLPLA